MPINTGDKVQNQNYLEAGFDDDFNNAVQRQIERSMFTLISKEKEYATEDRLHNFNIAAVLKGENPLQALAGMMAKHTVSIYDMCMGNRDYPIELWQEKITDHINYLLLLAYAVEQKNKESEAKENVR